MMSTDSESTIQKHRNIAFLKEIFSRNHLFICPLEASSKQAEKAEGSKGAKTMEAGFGHFSPSFA